VGSSGQGGRAWEHTGRGARKGAPYTDTPSSLRLRRTSVWRPHAPPAHSPHSSSAHFDDDRLWHVSPFACAHMHLWCSTQKAVLRKVYTTRQHRHIAVPFSDDNCSTRALSAKDGALTWARTENAPGQFSRWSPRVRKVAPRHVERSAGSFGVRRKKPHLAAPDGKQMARSACTSVRSCRQPPSPQRA